MHHAEHHEDQTHLAAKNLQCGLGIYRFGPIFQSQSNETDVNEIKTDDQQVVDGIGQGLVAKETIDEEDTPILVKCASNPDGQCYADREISQVTPNDNGITGAFDSRDRRCHDVFLSSISISDVSVITEIIGQLGDFAS